MYINLLVIGAYMAAMIGLGIYLKRYVRTDADFFIAGRRLNQWVIAGTVMATNVAAIYLVGPAGAAYSGGVSVLLIAWTGNMIAAFSALVFVPRLRRLEVTTVSEFMEQRYGLWLRIALAVMWIIYYALFAGNAMYTLATVLSPVLPFSTGVIIACVGGSVIVYCFASGLLAVVYSDVIQSFLIILGGIILLPLSVKAVGGVTELVTALPDSHFLLWRSGDVWPTWKDIVMFTLLGLPFWCTSQYMLQRSFAGRTARDASKGILLAALLTGPLTLTYILPGLCGGIMYQGEGTLEAADTVLPRLIVDIMPIGLAGLLPAALVAASNSTASSLLNSLATLFENDVYRRFRQGQGEQRFLLVGRLATVVGGLIGLLFAFNVGTLGGIIKANYIIMSFFEPPIFVIVAAALFWRRANACGAGVTLVTGLVFNLLGMFVWDMSEADRTIWGFPVCIAAMVLGSLLFALLFRHHGAEQQERHIALARKAKESIQGRDVQAWCGVLLAIIALSVFIGCAVHEEYLTRPYNIVVFMLEMMLFVWGCYLALPLFVGEDAAPQETQADSIESSLIHRIVGNGWTWLVVYIIAIALVVLLYVA